MKKTNRIAAFILVFAIMIEFCSFNALSAMESSNYISSASATLSQGSSSGELSLSYSITGMSIMNTIGIFRIKVYKSNGTIYKTILGTTTNGLLVSNRASTGGTFTISGVPGNYYYCVVTFYASNSSGSDSIPITTNTARAKP